MQKERAEVVVRVTKREEDNTATDSDKQTLPSNPTQMTHLSFLVETSIVKRGEEEDAENDTVTKSASTSKHSDPLRRRASARSLASLGDKRAKADSCFSFWSTSVPVVSSAERLHCLTSEFFESNKYVSSSWPSPPRPRGDESINNVIEKERGVYLEATLKVRRGEMEGWSDRSKKLGDDWFFLQIQRVKRRKGDDSSYKYIYPTNIIIIHIKQ